MAAKRAKLALASAENALTKAGGARVSPKAGRLFAAYLTNAATRISEEAARLATHAGRKTVVAADIRLAWKNLQDELAR